MREDRRFSREEITALVAGPVFGANDEDDDEDEDEEEEEKKKGEENDEEEEEEEPVWTASAAGRVLTGASDAICVSLYCRA